MYNGGKIILGLLVFVALFAFPFYNNIGKATVEPEPKTDTPAILQWEKEHGKKECVESRAFMRAGHMQMLNNWRDSVVRNGDRLYVNSQGKTFHMSLQNTCMNCHSNKKEFCDKCHNYVGVTPYCWSCHIAPKEKES
jgi:hypothetical protein